MWQDLRRPVQSQGTAKWDAPYVSTTPALERQKTRHVIFFSKKKAYSTSTRVEARLLSLSVGG